MNARAFYTILVLSIPHTPTEKGCELSCKVKGFAHTGCPSVVGATEHMWTRFLPNTNLGCLYERRFFKLKLAENLSAQSLVQLLTV